MNICSASVNQAHSQHLQRGFHFTEYLFHIWSNVAGNWSHIQFIHDHVNLHISNLQKDNMVLKYGFLLVTFYLGLYLGNRVDHAHIFD